MVEFRFVRWLENYDKYFAVFIVVDTGEEFIVPRSRLIPHPVFEYTHPEVKDPNRLAELAAETNHLFSIPIFRWYMHKVWTKKNPMSIDDEDIELAYEFPSTIDFSCVRDCLLRGEIHDLCVEKCSKF